MSLKKNLKLHTLTALLTLSLVVGLSALPSVGVNSAQAFDQLNPAGTACGGSPFNGSKGEYLAGDFHNHTPFSDGTASVPLLVGKAMQNLDWFAQSGHGGAYSRDGRYSDPEYDASGSGEGKFLVDTVGEAAFKGDNTAPAQYGRRSMWRWQSIQSYLYPVTWQNSMVLKRPIWSGVEWEVPGHEHCSAGIITGQFPRNGKIGNANALAQFEYLFDMEDQDTSAGGGQGWTGKIPNPPKTPTAADPHPGITGHAKAVAAATWAEQNHRHTSYLIFAHIERKGVWKQDSGGNSTGYNIEHFRDFNNAAPHVCFGFEGQPGHQAESDRGGFGSGAFPSGKEVVAGQGAIPGGTFGGTGYYSATIGYMWDALLGEGRNWWLFASSDFHSRSVPEYESSDYPAPDPNSDQPVANPHTLNSGWRGATATKADFWPGEYQKDYVYVNKTNNPSAQDVLDGMRSGNSFIVQGDLIRGLKFTAKARGSEATIGEVLTVAPGEHVLIKVMVHVPDVNNLCPYAFDNPSLAQLNVHQSLNRPVLHHVDLIGGEVYGKRTPGTDAYKDPTNPTATIKQKVLVSEMKDEGRGWKSFTFACTPTKSCYFRLRGTNMPPNTPNETDADGNPLSDTLAKNIMYDYPGKGSTALDADVEAWADLWFYSNPITIKVAGGHHLACK
jgi:hypothetical protein